MYMCSHVFTDLDTSEVMHMTYMCILSSCDSLRMKLLKCSLFEPLQTALNK